jgi:ubiquinone/menaquinone biosynthesis C-methylase UbiE
MFNRLVSKNLRKPTGLAGIVMGWLMNRFNNGIINMSLNAVPKENNNRIVEVGIGNGKALHELAKRFPYAQLYGVDISTTMLKRAKQRNKKLIAQRRLFLQLNSIEKMDIDPDSVDTLLTVNTIYFWKNPDLALEEIRRILKKGGCFILSFNPKEEMQKRIYPPDIFTLYSLRQVKDLLEKHQFSLIKTMELSDHLEKYVCVVAEKA